MNPLTPIPVSSSTLPPPSSPQPSLIIPPTTVPFHSPTFDNIMQQPITTLFSSQSVDQDMMNAKEDEHIDFSELEFDPDEEDVEYHAIMPGKQYKILNSKLNTLLQFLNDSSAFTTSFVVGEDVEFLLKGQETKMKNLVDKAISQLETRLSIYMSSFTYDIIKIKKYGL